MDQIGTTVAAGPVLHLVRHGETAWNAEGRLQGWTDIPLNATGIRQAQAAAATLAARPIGAVLSSDLTRARDTAESIARRAGLEVIVAPALRERGYGTAEGRHDDDLAAEYGGRLTELWEDPDFAFPGGESRRQTYDRVSAFLGPLLTSPPAGEIVLVSHGGTLRVIRGVLERVAVQDLPRWHFGNGEVHTVMAALTAP